MSEYGFEGRVAIVTGAGRGIGAQTAKTYAEAGADLVLAARTKEQASAFLSFRNWPNFTAAP